MASRPTKRPEAVEDTSATLETLLANEAGVSNLSTLTYAQLDTYIDNNITNLADARAFLKKLGRILLFVLKKEYF